jgi:hypothetical protein
VWEAFYRQIENVARRPKRNEIPRGIYWVRKKKVVEFKEFEQILKIAVSLNLTKFIIFDDVHIYKVIDEILFT